MPGRVSMIQKYFMIYLDDLKCYVAKKHDVNKRAELIRGCWEAVKTNRKLGE